MNEEIKSAIEAGLAEVKNKVEAATEKGRTEIAEQIKNLQEQITAANANGVDRETVEKMQEHLDSLDIKMQKSGRGGNIEQKSFNELLGEAIEDNAARIQAISKSRGETSIEMKAAGDMSYASNFAGGVQANATTDYRTAMLPQRDATVYLRDIIPAGTTDAASIWYPVANGGEGAPAPWTEGTDKPIFDFDFTSKSTPVQWIAGIVRVPRAMLDDVKFLKSFLQANMLKALYKAENAQILNGDGTGANLLGLMPQASTYDGNNTILVEQLVDAAYGQLAEKGHNASHIVLNARDAVDIALNKAAGSGEYDLPGATGFVNGRLTLAGLPVLSMPTTQLAAGNYLVGDFSATQLITRLNPEIRFFEQNEDDVRKNMITIRIEERIALATYYPDAFVKKANV